MGEHHNESKEQLPSWEGVSQKISSKCKNYMLLRPSALSPFISFIAGQEDHQRGFSRVSRAEDVATTDEEARMSSKAKKIYVFDRF